MSLILLHSRHYYELSSAHQPPLLHAVAFHVRGSGDAVDVVSLSLKGKRHCEPAKDLTGEPSLCLLQPWTPHHDFRLDLSKIISVSCPSVALSISLWVSLSQLSFLVWYGLSPLHPFSSSVGAVSRFSYLQNTPVYGMIIYLAAQPYSLASLCICLPDCNFLPYPSLFPPSTSLLLLSTYPITSVLRSLSFHPHIFLQSPLAISAKLLTFIVR